MVLESWVSNLDSIRTRESPSHPRVLLSGKGSKWERSASSIHAISLWGTIRQVFRDVWPAGNHLQAAPVVHAAWQRIVQRPTELSPPGARKQLPHLACHLRSEPMPVGHSVLSRLPLDVQHHRAQKSCPHKGLCPTAGHQFHEH